MFRQRYPTDFSLTVTSHDTLTEEQTQALKEFTSDGLSVKNENSYTYLYAMGILEDGSLRFADIYEENRDLSRYWDVYILDLAAYNRLSGNDAALADGEVLLAVFFSVVFTLATVLIIYYKQISEGYEDAARFEIMQKVGMTRRDIRRLLLMAGLDNTPLFAAAAGGCFAVFAVIYGVVYRMTSNAYYHLVSASA